MWGQLKCPVHIRLKSTLTNQTVVGTVLGYNAWYNTKVCANVCISDSSQAKHHYLSIKYNMTDTAVEMQHVFWDRITTFYMAFWLFSGFRRLTHNENIKIKLLNFEHMIGDGNEWGGILKKPRKNVSTLSCWYTHIAITDVSQFNTWLIFNTTCYWIHGRFRILYRQLLLRRKNASVTCKRKKFQYSRLLECYVVSLGKRFPTFRRKRTGSRNLLAIKTQMFFISFWQARILQTVICCPILNIRLHLFKGLTPSNNATNPLNSRSQWSCGLDCWDRWFESRWEYECSSLVFVVTCVGSGLCGELITRLEESYRMSVSNFVWSRNPKMGPSRPNLVCNATEKEKKNNLQWYQLLSHSQYFQ